MAGRLPPFAVVKAFESIARQRHQSVKQAVDELCLILSAVSHQIRVLEIYFNTVLLERDSIQMQLTLAGRTDAGKLTTLINVFDENKRQVREAGHRPFCVITTPCLAARWLVPRLDRLRLATARCRDITEILDE